MRLRNSAGFQSSRKAFLLYGNRGNELTKAFRNNAAGKCAGNDGGFLEPFGNVSVFVVFRAVEGMKAAEELSR